jgi:hypothetical protein
MMITYSPVRGNLSSPATTGYLITGERCYGEGGFTGNVAVQGALVVTLTPLSASSVQCASSGYISEGDSEPEPLGETKVLTNRRDAEGNFTGFFMPFPVPTVLNVSTFQENVVAQYEGKRYLEIEGQSVRTFLYCYIVTEVQSILRYEWYFEASSGVLLKFLKAIEINFMRVQWESYEATNTTLTLTGTHPITAFFANIQTQFYAAIGALVITILGYYFLTQRKSSAGGAAL